MISGKIIYKNLNNSFYFRMEEKIFEGKKYFMHVDVFKYNRKTIDEMFEFMCVVLDVLNKNGINEIYFMQEADDDLLLKFASKFFNWEYVTTLTLTNGIEYNILRHSF